jgi:phage FluMu protein Com
MSLQIRCVSCRKKLHVRDQFLGKKIKCPICRHAFVAKDNHAPVAVAANHSYTPRLSRQELRGTPRRNKLLWFSMAAMVTFLLIAAGSYVMLLLPSA